jgi:type VI secretion system secreted protein Hcp
MRSYILVLALGLVLVVTAVTAASAASSVFLRVDGIAGDVAVAAHEGDIEVLGYTFGVTQTPSRGGAGGAAAGKAQAQDLRVTKRLDMASVPLYLNAVTGKHLTQVRLAAARAGQDGQLQDYFIVTLEDVLISSYSSSGTGESGSLSPIEEVTFSFGKITLQYLAQLEGGSYGPVATASWDVKTNVAGTATTTGPQPAAVREQTGTVRAVGDVLRRVLTPAK